MTEPYAAPSPQPPAAPTPPAPSVTGAPRLDLPYYGAPFGAAIRRFFQNYAEFHGRASRAEYWWIALLQLLIYLVLGIAGGIVGSIGATTDPYTGSSTPGAGFAPFAIVLVLWFLATIVPNISLTVRRLHDANFSGFLVLLQLIPYLGGLIVLIMCIVGPNPMGRRFDRGMTGSQPPPPPVAG